MKSLVILSGTHASYTMVSGHFDLKCASVVLLVMFFLSIFAAFLFCHFGFLEAWKARNAVYLILLYDNVI
jgi:hypothetical protein